MTSNRRQFLAAAAAASASVGAVAAEARAATAAQTGALKQDPLLTHVRMRGRIDGRPCYYWYHGTFYGQVSGERTQALLAIEGVSKQIIEPQSGGDWLYRLREAGWFLDLASSTVVDEWRNPFNDRVVAPKHYSSAQQLTFGREAVKPAVAELPPGMEWRGYITDPVIHGADVWSTEELLVKIPDKSGEARKARVPTTLAYQTLASWRPWMEMGDVAGVISWRLAGRKCQRLDELPAALRARVEQQTPEVFELT
ncbi:MAG: DUF1838 family protein [Proteobacteria bacterium]|nr:DUF1838 family protein [Pseudomonadota bacterium]